MAAADPDQATASAPDDNGCPTPHGAQPFPAVEEASGDSETSLGPPSDDHAVFDGDDDDQESCCCLDTHVIDDDKEEKEEEEEEVGEGDEAVVTTKGGEEEEGVVDPVEDNRLFWETCLASGYP
ncbi:uncharacterized protein LOC103986494 [Musa acuminata AAA Group]|uniref:(wild Malaysian banana) hypothetical protein n=1 Tax=Musa acuminata subsp. malaccensis TaxID=214687 RepID=A0A804J9V1_MUSAM|nr:PREDICTED: uncharacterized protein LOC103986494 [Musa acuminata subsp. malaccensis]CAG1840350.1 unnamed protein product [Musa acuminata subsp. malaccensis]